MKPAFSLFCLYLRHTFWKVLLLLLAAGGCLVWGLRQALRQEAPDRDDDNHRKEAAPHAPAETP